jgi:hypothetical protein
MKGIAFTAIVLLICLTGTYGVRKTGLFDQQKVINLEITVPNMPGSNLFAKLGPQYNGNKGTLANLIDENALVGLRYRQQEGEGEGESSAQKLSDAGTAKTINQMNAVYKQQLEAADKNIEKSVIKNDE